MWTYPALTEMNSPPDGMVFSASSPPPQQATEPSALTPQVWVQPAATNENSPPGGEALPKKIAPPASDVAVGAYPTSVVRPGADGCELGYHSSASRAAVSHPQLLQFLFRQAHTENVLINAAGLNHACDEFPGHTFNGFDDRRLVLEPYRKQYIENVQVLRLTLSGSGGIV